MRMRECGNGHRFPTFEVLRPVYRNNPARVQSAAHAAEARALRYRRNLQIRADSEVMSSAEAARRHGVTPTLATYIRLKWKP